MSIHAERRARRGARGRLVLLGVLSVLGASMGCSLVDLCYLNPSTCEGANASPPESGSDASDSRASDASGSDASPCDAGADPCTCLAPLKQFTGCGTVQALLAQTPYAYWLGAGDGSGRQLCRASAADSSQTVTPLSTGLTRWTDFYGGFAVDAEYVYLGYWTPSPPSIVRRPLGDGALTPLIPSLPSATFALVAVPNGLYWLDSHHDVCMSARDGTIAPGDSGCGGAPLALGPDDAALPNLSTATHNRDYLAVNAESVYQTFYQTGVIASIARDGGAITVLNKGATQQVRRIAASDTDVVWSEPSGSVHAIQHVAATGGAVTALTTNAASGGLAIDDTWVYFAVATQNTFQIDRVPLAGGAAELVACAPPVLPSAPDLIAVDDGTVYFGSGNDDNRIYAAPK